MGVRISFASPHGQLLKLRVATVTALDERPHPARLADLPLAGGVAGEVAERARGVALRVRVVVPREPHEGRHRQGTRDCHLHLRQQPLQPSLRSEQGVPSYTHTHDVPAEAR